MEHVGDRAFAYCDKLERVKQVIVCGAGEYQRLKTNSIWDGGTRYLSYELPVSKKNYYLAADAFGQGKTHKIPRGLKRLFVTRRDVRQGPAIFDSAFGMIPELQNIFWPADSQEADEKEALKRLPEEGFPTPDPEMERMSRKLNGERPNHLGNIETCRSTVFLFDDRSTRLVDGKYYVIGEYDVGYHFWQSLQREESGNAIGASVLETYIQALRTAIEGMTEGKRYVYKRCVLGAAANPYYSKLDYISFPTGYYVDGGRK